LCSGGGCAAADRRAHSSSDLIGSVHWSVDYTVPVDRLRRKLGEIVRSTPLWDGKVVALQVVEALAGTITLRALVSARNSSDAWDLRCHVREEMIAFLQREYPEALPRHRAELVGGADSRARTPEPADRVTAG
jgi:hypothetical protein